MTRRRDYHWQLIRLMMDGKRFSVLEATEAVGCNRANMERMIGLMHEHRLIYIYSYGASTRTRHRIWAWRDDNQSDAERPRRMTNAERCQSYQNKKQALSGTVRLGFWEL